jgi:hypothetical protein
MSNYDRVFTLSGTSFHPDGTTSLPVFCDSTPARPERIAFLRFPCMKERHVVQINHAGFALPSAGKLDFRLTAL